MSKPDQIAHRAREVSMAKTSLLRTVVSNRVVASAGNCTSKSATSVITRKNKK